MDKTRGSFVNCTFERNSVESLSQRDDYGGAVCGTTDSYLTVHHCLFKENTANHRGGATYIQVSHININLCLFRKNRVTYGGACYIQRSQGSFEHCTFEGKV